MLIRLITKLAKTLDGIDVSQYEEGSVIALTERDARLLIAEGWAEPVGSGRERRYISPSVPNREIAAEDETLPRARGPRIRKTSGDTGNRD
jgi:hypothetical protein